MHESVIFLNALQRTPAERAAFLDEACGDDSRLRADVDALLRAHDTDPEFLEHPLGNPGTTLDLPNGASTASDSPTEGEQGGAVLAERYELAELLGEGGMGTVWKARQIHPIKRSVAVKLIKLGMDSKAVLRRFEQERQALALMDHPNIARVFDAGTAPNGRPFFVMELVNGVPITRYCDEHRLTIRQRLDLFVSVCHAVQHAHQKGIIHRDLKPSNVLVVAGDSHPSPKVIDFGVAKATGELLTEQSLHTGFGTMIGTPEYMSPEQANFDQTDVDTRSDVYSLGVLLYELLVGIPPLNRLGNGPKGVLELLRDVREVEVPRPSVKLSTKEARDTVADLRQTDPRKLMRAIQGELDWIVLKALEKDRTRRYETVSAFALDVQHFLKDEPVQACPPGAGYRVRKFVRRNRGAVLASVAILSMLLITLVVALKSNADVRVALNDRTGAFHSLEIEQHATAAALLREKELKQQEVELRNKTGTALDEARLALYSYRVTLGFREQEAGHIARAEFLLNDCPAAMRDWEWHYLKRQCHLDMLTIPGDLQQVRHAAAQCLGDGRRIASFVGYAVVVRDPDDGRETARIPFRKPLGSRENAPVLTPSGYFVETDGETVFLRNLLIDSPERTIPVAKGDRAWISSVSDDGAYVATVMKAAGPASQEYLLQVWDTGSARVLFQANANLPYQFASAFGRRTNETQFFHRDGEEWIVRAVPSGQETKRWRDVRPATNLTQSPDGRLLALWDVLGQVQVRETERNQILRELRIQDGTLRDVAFHPKIPMLATAHDDHIIRIWNVVRGQLWLTIRGHASAVRSLAFRSDGNRLISTDSEGTLKIWDTSQILYGAEPGSVSHRFLESNNVSLSLAGNGSRLAVRGNRGALFWPDGDARPISYVEDAVGQIALDRNGDRAAVTRFRSSDIEVWDPKSGKTIAVCRGHREHIRSFAFSPTDDTLASAGFDGTIRFWDATTGNEKQYIAWKDKAPSMLAFHPDGKRLAVISGDRRVTLWNIATGTEHWQVERMLARTACLAFSRDGRLLALGSDRSIEIRDAETGELRLTLPGHSREVLAVAFHPAGRRLAAATADGALTVWDLGLAREAFALPGGGPLFQSGVAFSPDGRRLYRVDRGGFIQVLNATPLPDADSNQRSIGKN